MLTNIDNFEFIVLNLHQSVDPIAIFYHYERKETLNAEAYMQHDSG